MALTQWQLKPVATDTIASGDFLAFTDENETGDPINKLTVDNLATFFAGTGIGASSGVLSVDAAQTVITSLLATNIKIGEDDQTKIDFETVDEIHLYAANVHQVKLVDNAFTPQADSDVDLGASGTYWKDAYIDKITTTGNIELGSTTDTTLSGSSGELSVEGTVVKKVGTENIWVPAAAMTPRDNAGCADIATVAAGTSGRPDFHVLDFDKDSDEHAQFTIAMPKSWDGGNVYYYVYWIGLAATTGVAWGLEVLSLNDNEEFNQAYVNPIIVQDDSQGDVTELLVSAKSAAIACSGADNDLLCFQVYRDVSDGNDDMAGDARLWGLLLEYTTNASTDA